MESRSHLYLPVSSRRPIDLFSRDVQAMAVRTALLDFDHALDSVRYNQHVGGVQHFVFYDERDAVRRGSRSARLRSEVIGVGAKSESNARALELMRTIRPVQGAILEMLCDRESQDVLADGVAAGVASMSCVGIFRRKLYVRLSGPVDLVLRTHEHLGEHVLKRYSTQFY